MTTLDNLCISYIIKKRVAIMERGDFTMKKKVLLLCVFLTVMFMTPKTVNADIGPKPSVIVDFDSFQDHTYYVALISSSFSTGPQDGLTESDLEHYLSLEEDEQFEDYDIFIKFATYKDVDDFYFLREYSDCSKSHMYSWDYYPPEVFKVLVYFPETDSFMVSDILERYAFDSYFRVELSESSLIVNTSFKTHVVILSFIARSLLTVLIEIGIAWLFKFRERKQIRFIAIVNIITQLALNLVLGYIGHKLGMFGFILFYIFLEFLIFIVEAIAYSIYLKKKSIKKVPVFMSILYAFVANIASFCIGIALAFIIPSIF